MLRRRLILFLVPLLLTPCILRAAEERVPHEISGFRLGASIDQYEFISAYNYLKVMTVEDIGGFRKGEIWYGTCDRPGEVVRIKMKYHDSSREFYDRLLKSFKEKFGDPDEFTGDAFGIVLDWKWRFTDKDGKYITLSLQHNLKNIDENIGNMVKLTMPDRMEAERLCFNRRYERKKPDIPAAMLSREWENMIPR
jgi:hypothetical protein